VRRGGNGGIPGAALLFALLPAAFATCALAQETTFHPEALLEYGYNSNLLTQSAGQETGDNMTRVALGLPVNRNWRSGTLDFWYQPSYQWYGDNTDLNHDEHRVRFGVTAEPGPRSALDYGLAWSRTQPQGKIGEALAGDTVLVPRSEQDLTYTNLRYQREFSRRMSWHAAAEALRNTHTLLEDPEADPTTQGLEDRSTYAAFAGLARATSRKDRLGFEARWDYYKLEVTGEERVGQLSLTWDRDVPDSYAVSLRIGAYRRDIEPGRVEVPVDPGQESGLAMGVSVARLFAASRLELSASRAPSAGGSIVGTSTDTKAALTWSGSPNPRWDWELRSSYVLRVPTAAGEPDIENLGGAGRLEWRPGRHAALRLAASYTERTTDDPTLDATVWIATLGVVWLPRGPQIPSGGGQ